jgi:uncharacterized protein
MSRFKAAAWLIVLLLVSLSVIAAEDIKVPQYRGYVNDFANIIPQSDEEAIANYIGAVERATTAEVAVVTMGSVKPYTIAQYAIALAEQWGVGKEGKDNGVIILVAVKDREMRIEVGYGLEHLIPDAEAWRIVDKLMRPAFKRDDYAFGISQAVMQIGSIIADDQGVAIQQPAGTVAPRKRQGGGALFFFIIIILAFVLRLRLWPFLLLGGMSRGRHWSGGGFSSGGGGFGGGFGGFGGGGFGGGGASGSW